MSFLSPRKLLLRMIRCIKSWKRTYAFPHHKFSVCRFFFSVFFIMWSVTIDLCILLFKCIISLYGMLSYVLYICVRVCVWMCHIKKNQHSLWLARKYIYMYIYINDMFNFRTCNLIFYVTNAELKREIE